MLKQRSVTIH